MPQLSFTEAARLAGVDASTLHRKVKRGELSAVTQANGRRVIDLAELLRLYPDLATDSGMPSGMPPGMPGHARDDASLQALADKAALLDRELQAARERESRLLALLEQEQAARRALEQHLLPGPRRGWLARLVAAVRRP